MVSLEFENSPVRSVQVDPASLTKTDHDSKESNLQQMSSPRPKRGRRHIDDALLRNWSFASSPPLSESPSSPLLSSPVFPLRRPRGRPRLNPLPEGGDTDNIKPAQVAEGGDLASAKKRKRCRNRKYQNGEYITDKEKEANRENDERLVDGENEETGKYKYVALGDLGSCVYKHCAYTKRLLALIFMHTWDVSAEVVLVFLIHLLGDSYCFFTSNFCSF